MEDRIDIIQYLEEALAAVEFEPSDDYQLGHLAALEEMYDFFNEG